MKVGNRNKLDDFAVFFLAFFEAGLLVLLNRSVCGCAQVDESGLVDSVEVPGQSESSLEAIVQAVESRLVFAAIRVRWTFFQHYQMIKFLILFNLNKINGVVFKCENDCL